MLGRRKIKSALFVDFDNVVQVVGRDFGGSIPNWIAWLEDGEFEDEKRKRTIEIKRVYWNSHNEVFRKVFEENGFEAETCPHRVKTKKSTADMVIAIDVLQTLYENKGINEFILLTTDTDFVTLIDKLDEFDKRTVSGANEKIPTVYTVFKDHADAVIRMFELKEACSYERKRLSGLLTRKTKGKTGSSAAPSPKTAPVPPPDKPDKTKARSRARPSDTERRTLLVAAASHLLDIAKGTPGLPLGRRTVARALEKRMPEFKVDGAWPYLGCGSYTQMLESIVKIRPELQLIKYKEGGMAIVFPTDE